VPTYEVIYLIAKPKFKLAPQKNGYGDVWEFPQEFKNKHPAPFPVALPLRCIDNYGVYTYPNIETFEKNPEIFRDII
jgi:DNA modification methylase